MVRFIIDSTFGVSKEYAKKHNLEVVNLKLVLDGVVTDEGYEENWAEFYTRLKASKAFPTTSQPSPQDFMDAIDKILKQDENSEIIVLTIASGLSGTINGATVAVNAYPGKKICALDSMQATTCGRIMTEELVMHAENGKTYEELLVIYQQLINSLKILFIPDNMESLKRGGRIGTLGATIADIFKIKPIFCFQKNKVEVPKKTFGFTKAVVDVISMLPKNLKRLYVCYIHNDINVPLIVAKLKQILKIENVETVAVSPVFGVHVGIGAVGIASLAEY